MNKHINKTIIYMLVALIVVSASLIVMNTMRDSVAVEKAKEAYALYMQENPASKNSDFIYIYEEHIVIAIRGGKVLSKEYVSEAHAVKAATGNSKVLHYSLSSTGDDRLFIVKVFDKQSDIFALGSQKLAAGADSLIIKVVSNGMIFANFEIPAAAIADKNSPVEVTISKIDPKENVKLGDNQEGFAYDIDVTNLVENNTSLIKVSMSGPKGLVSGTKSEAISVYHKSSAIASTYDAKTGEVAFETTDFSPYTFVYDMVTVTTVEDLRYYLQRQGNINIKLGDNITIDLTSGASATGGREDTGADANGEVFTYDKTLADGTKEKVYYARGFYNNKWIYFGALVGREKTIDLSGYTITFKGDSAKGDNALFCVNNNSSLTIIDSTRTVTSKDAGENEVKTVVRGRVEVQSEHYAVWSVNPTSTVNIYDGIFVTDEYAGFTVTANNMPLLYSSGGKINVYGGYYLYTGRGGFNVTDDITTPRIWIYEGVRLSNSVYAWGDTKSIVHVGDAKLSDTAEAGLKVATADAAGSFENWYTVKGQKIEVIQTLHNDKYLYRVGNENAFPLGVFFNQILDDIDISNVSVRFVDIATTNEYNAQNPYDKTDSRYYGYIADQTTAVAEQKSAATLAEYTVKFLNSFTGPVRLELHNGNGVIYASINLEVVEGYNVYDLDNNPDAVKLYSPNSTNKDVCLLSKITLVKSNAITIKDGYAFYGNGFVITDIRDQRTETKKINSVDTVVSSASGTAGLIQIVDGTLDNVQIDGYQSNDAGAGVNDAGRAPIVAVTGSATIYNSYIQGGRQAVHMTGTGTLHIKNTTLDGGSRANMEISSGDIILENCVTTTDTTGGAKGIGIMVTSTSVKLTLEGTFTQYNWLKSSDLDSTYSAILSSIYSDSNYAYNSHINLGIFFFAEGVVFTEDQASSQITDNTGNDYGYVEKTASGYKATCYMPKATMGADTFTAPTYEVQGNHPIAPKPVFDFTDKNYVGKGSGETENDYCYYNENGYVEISFQKDSDEEGWNWNPDILTVTKLGRTLKPSVSMNGTDYTGKTITFTEAGTYELTYIYDDPYNCTANHASYSQTYTQKLIIKVTVVTPETVVYHPEFTYTQGYGSSTGTTASTSVIVNNKTYVMPNVAGTSDTIGSKTMSDGTVIYYPIVTVGGYNSSGNSYSSGKIYLFSPAFKAINIRDFYQDGENAGNQQYFYDATSNTQKWPHGVDSASAGDPQVSANFGYINPNNDYRYEPYTRNMSSNQGLVYNSIHGLSFRCDSIEKDVSADTRLVEFYYVGNDNVTYYYYIQYKQEAVPYESSVCVTADTLVTLADGTQKRIDQVTYDDMLLAWDFDKGAFTAVNSAVIGNHGYDYNDVIELTFEDGSTIKFVNAHGLFDADLNRWVDIGAENAKDFIGHRFTQLDGNSYKTVKLTDVDVRVEYVEAWWLLTTGHYNCILNGLFTETPPITTQMAIFEIGADMKYDAEAKAADIEKYGLYTYEELAHLMTYEEFETLNIAYVKIAVGKGLVTYKEFFGCEPISKAN